MVKMGLKLKNVVPLMFVPSSRIECYTAVLHPGETSVVLRCCTVSFLYLLCFEALLLFLHFVMY
jgi:hypothetical protein